MIVLSAVRRRQDRTALARVDMLVEKKSLVKDDLWDTDGFKIRFLKIIYWK